MITINDLIRTSDVIGGFYVKNKLSLTFELVLENLYSDHSCLEEYKVKLHLFLLSFGLKVWQDKSKPGRVKRFANTKKRNCRNSFCFFKFSCFLFIVFEFEKSF